MPDLNKIIEDLSSLTVAEAADLSKQLEEKWGPPAEFFVEGVQSLHVFIELVWIWHQYKFSSWSVSITQSLVGIATQRREKPSSS